MKQLCCIVSLLILTMNISAQLNTNYLKKTWFGSTDNEYLKLTDTCAIIELNQDYLVEQYNWSILDSVLLFNNKPFGKIINLTKDALMLKKLYEGGPCYPGWFYGLKNLDDCVILFRDSNYFVDKNIYFKAISFATTSVFGGSYIYYVQIKRNGKFYNFSLLDKNTTYYKGRLTQPEIDNINRIVQGSRLNKLHRGYGGMVIDGSETTFLIKTNKGNFSMSSTMYPHIYEQLFSEIQRLKNHVSLNPCRNKKKLRRGFKALR